MNSMGTYYDITDEKCIRETVYNRDGELFTKKETVITKDAFLECYRKWVKEAKA